MKKISALLGIIFCLIFAGVGLSFSQSAEELFERGKENFSKTEYKKANDDFNKARALYLKAGDQAKAIESLGEMYRVQKMAAEFPFDEKQVLSHLAKAFPEESEAERLGWLKQGLVTTSTIDGKPYYFYQASDNVKFMRLDLMHKILKKEGKRNPFFEKTKDFVFRLPEAESGKAFWKPYVNPVKFSGTGEMTLARKDLPQKGIFRIWIPLPIITAAQTDVRITSIEPAEFVMTAPSIDYDIGLVYLEIPLENLKNDLRVSVNFEFTHYEQRFIIDANNVGEYDKNSLLYQQYTRSYRNTTYNDEIKKKAREIVGDEKNPYLAAKKIYDYIVKNISYNFMPHGMLDALQKPESIFVHEKKWGDCGAQSAYFSALLRSIGIPARTTGGLQLVPTVEGDHFWAEVYLPNYGWIPVDVTIAESADWDSLITPEENKKFKEYYFGNLDPYRFVIQKDIDLPVNPVSQLPVFFTMAIQQPVVECLESEENPNFSVDKNWKLKIYQIIN